MKKIIALTLTLITILSIFCGCDIQSIEKTMIKMEESAAESKQASQNALHPIVADDIIDRVTISVGDTIFDANEFIFFRDKYTDVMYLATRGKYDYQMTVMLKPDGLPMLYSEWLQLHEGKPIEEVLATEPIEETTEEIERE